MFLRVAAGRHAAKAFGGTMTAALLTQIPISAYSTIIMLLFSLLASQQLALLNFFYPNANLQAFPVLLLPAVLATVLLKKRLSKSWSFRTCFRLS